MIDTCLQAMITQIKYESTLRRMIVEEAKDGTPDLTFKDLEAKIQGMFQIPPYNRLIVTYMDQDNEIVTMGDNFDLYDACIVQRIDPLRMVVKVEMTKPDGVDLKEAPQTKLFQSSTTVQSLKNPPNCSEATEQLLSEDVKSLMKVAKAQEASFSLCKGVQFVQCNGCSMVTMAGPRSRSIRKYQNYLCLRCFSGHVDQSDHWRYDYPIHSQRNTLSMLPKRKMARYLSSQSTAFALHPPKVPAWKHNVPGHQHVPLFSFNKDNHHSPKSLDSRFVQHLTFSDGTEVCVGTRFTKSWRLRNIGTLPWPPATQLVCVGGDVLGSQKLSTLETPNCGLLSGEEIDASVDLVAPERLGRFVSYWRLMAPTGQKFGQRIWVVIQAISTPQQPSKANESSQEQFHKQLIGMEKHKQSACFIGNGNEIIGAVEEQRKLPRSSDNDIERSQRMAAHPGDDGASLQLLLSVNKDGCKSMEDSVPDHPCPMQPDAEHAAHLDVAKSGVGHFSVVENPDEASMEARSKGLSEDSHLTNDPGLDEQTTCLAIAEDYELSDCQEDIILDMLNSMGFTQRTLNLELLRKNKNDMQGTVDDLVVASEWDHILDDLEEMGFYNAEMNCRLLSKNNGSVKLVVKELMQMQNPWGGGGEKQ